MTYWINTRIIKLLQSSNLKWLPGILKILLGDFIDILSRIADIETYKQVFHHSNGKEIECPSNIFRYSIIVCPKSNSLIFSNSFKAISLKRIFEYNMRY